MKAIANFDFSPQSPDIQETPCNILIVDDEERIREAYRHLLAGEGRIIEECGSGNEALRRLDHRDIDVLILDLMLPDINGLEIMEWMLHQHVPTAVVVFSGDESIDSAIRALRHGAFEFIRKHGDPQELIDTVDRVLRRRRVEREHALMTVRLEQSERLHRFLVEQSPDIIYTLDKDGAFIFVNGRVQALLGYTREELLGKHYSMIVYPDDLEHARFAFNERRIGDRASTNVEIRLQTKNQGVRHFENRTIVAILSAQGIYATNEEPASRYFMGTSGVARDITDRKKAEETIAFQAFHDLLTGLPNRILFKDRLGVALKQAKRKNKRVGVMFIDIDRFKLVNDTFGHAEGDLLLRAIASRLSATLRRGDTLARLGGDEFTVLLPDINQPEDAEVIARKVLEALATPVRLSQGEFRATVSVGIALFPRDGTTAEDLTRHADAAMYQVKRSGKNAFRFFDPELNSRHRDRIALENDLRGAVARGELDLHYQPQVSLATRDIVGLEALLRWNHPSLGAIPPTTFIQVAEEVGLIGELSNWVLETACTQLARWRADGVIAPRVSINLSACDFQRGDVVGKIRACLGRHDVAPDRLEVEITESLMMNDTADIAAKVRALREAGISVAIDDFGTGYSALAYLQRFPVSTLKIDRSFVRDLEGPMTNPIISAITGIARGFELDLVAEGVESLEQADALRALGCEVMQGYLFARPAPAADVLGWLRQPERLFPGAGNAGLQAAPA